MRYLRGLVNWMSRLRKTMSRRSKEYGDMAKKIRARKKEMSDAYKGLYKHIKIVYKCSKKGSKYRRKYGRRYRKARRGYGRARAARRARARRRASRNRKRALKYKQCGKRAQARYDRVLKRYCFFFYMSHSCI